MVSEGCVVHSFRHSMRDRLRAVECSKDIIDQIGGWSSSDVGESYGNGFSLQVLQKWMETLLLKNSTEIFCDKYESAKIMLC